jgi:hypothetical protein
VVIYKILHADDTPHRIALGVAVGLVTAFSPLIGLHMVLALLMSTLVGANRAISVLVVWVSNPATFLPILSFNWMVGHAIVPGSALHGRAEVKALLVQLVSTAEGTAPFVSRFFTLDFWNAVANLFVELGAELWVGSILVGAVMGVIGYFATRRAVVWRRRLRQLRRQRLARRALARTQATAAGTVPTQDHAPAEKPSASPPPKSEAELTTLP